MNLLREGCHHNKDENQIHLEKWIKFTIEPSDFDQDEFINANKQWLCNYLYQKLCQYVKENNFKELTWTAAFENPQVQAPDPCGIIYFEKTPIRWTFGLLPQYLGKTATYGLYADFIGSGIPDKTEK